MKETTYTGDGTGLMPQTPTEIVGEKCTNCVHRNDDFDCHAFCVPYDFDHYKAKEGDEEC